MQRITPCLWFDNQAEAAANFYVSVFKNARIGDIARYGKEGAAVSGQREGSVMTVAFELDGLSFVALNGGPHFKINEAVSLMVNCETQDEVDYYWDRLSAGGDPAAQVCGWLKDKFGVSWQIVPTALSELMKGAKAGNVMQALLQMKKLDIAALRRAAEPN
jgi:predicted 3-demethylubiquinone-9 3-methyltransferase (glyoxalase superfamily)